MREILYPNRQINEDVKILYTNDLLWTGLWHISATARGYDSGIAIVFSDGNILEKLLQEQHHWTQQSKIYGGYLNQPVL